MRRALGWVVSLLGAFAIGACGQGETSAPSAPGPSASTAQRVPPEGIVFARATATTRLVAGEVELPRRATIMVADPTDARVRSLTEAPGIDGDPAFSPDGREIVFSRTRVHPDRPPSSSLFVADIRTGEAHRLTNCEPPSCQAHAAPAWSPDGGAVGFLRMSDAGNEIVVLRLDGARERVLPVPKGVAPAGGPAWHPDGRELAFAAYRRGGHREGGGPYDIYSGALGGGELRKWEVCGGAGCGPISGVAWSPAGDTVAYAVAHGPGAGVHLVDVGADDVTERAHFPCGDDGCPEWPAWSPDGAWIVVADGDEFDRDLKLIHVESGEELGLTSGHFVDCCASWRPSK